VVSGTAQHHALNSPSPALLASLALLAVLIDFTNCVPDDDNNRSPVPHLSGSLSVPSAPASSLPSARTNSVSRSGVSPKSPPEADHVPVSSESPPSAPLVLSILVNVYFVREDIFCTFELESTVPIARLHM
jgi:hypothetical protein